MKKGWVTFAGAGPGAVDLLTVRCHKAIQEADIIIYAGSLVNPEVLKLAKKECKCKDSATMTLSEIVKEMVNAAKNDLKVLRLHTGDSSLYGATAEQMRLLNDQNISYETIPGVTAVFAAAASLNTELTMPGVSQTLIVSRQAGRTPVPENQELRKLGTHNATMALYLSVAGIDSVVKDLIDAGYHHNTPVAVVYRASWPDEKKIIGTLSDIAEKVHNNNITRQAMIILGDVLSGRGEESLLYNANFSHNFRDVKQNTKDIPTSQEMGLFTENNVMDEFLGNIAIYAITESGINTALKIKQKNKATLFLPLRYSKKVCESSETKFINFKNFGHQMAINWSKFDGHIFIMAAGIVVRKIAPLLKHKTVDPAVIVCDEKGKNAISLIGGHIAGANRLARMVAKNIGGSTILTTATDVQDIVAFDELAAKFGWEIKNPRDIKKLNTFLIEGKTIGFVAPKSIVNRYYSRNKNVIQLDKFPENENRYDGFVILDKIQEEVSSNKPIMFLCPYPLIVGIGCKKGTSEDDIERAIKKTCGDTLLDIKYISTISSVSLKEKEPGIHNFAKKMGISTNFIPAEQLNKIQTPSQSEFVNETTGTPSVAEASALFVGKGKLLVGKQKFGNVTVAIATDCSSKSGDTENIQKKKDVGILYVIGIGSGNSSSITPQAREEILFSEVIIGYTKYCELISSLTIGKEVISTGMQSEIERCDIALKRASLGQRVAMVCSGDAGVYGMAGLIFERKELNRIKNVTIEIVPGVTAANMGAAVVGAPLMNDFAVISLSDLLTERQVIINRLKTIAENDMTCVLYNPRSKKRKELFDLALELFEESRGENIPVALVSYAGRSKQSHWVGLLREIPVERVNMTTVVFIGSSHATIIDGKMVTRRGYQKKNTFHSSKK